MVKKCSTGIHSAEFALYRQALCWAVVYPGCIYLLCCGDGAFPGLPCPSLRTWYNDLVWGCNQGLGQLNPDTGKD